jgi:GDA1/CD39 (nucleoside phosphatase) family
MTPPVKHSIEAKDSFASYMTRTKREGDESESTLGEKLISEGHRNLKHKHKLDLELLAEQRQEELLEKLEIEQQARNEKAKRKHDKKKNQLLSDSGIETDTVHGLMIDAGSGGSRMHVFEWEPRVLGTVREVNEAVSGKKLTYPGSDSRWTDRLSPGIATFASKTDDQLLEVRGSKRIESFCTFKWLTCD